MAEMTDEKLRELLNIYAQHWEDCLNTHPDEYWELWGYVAKVTNKIANLNQNEYLCQALERHPHAADFTSLLRPSVRGETPTLSRVPSEVQYPKAYVNKICTRWLESLAKRIKGKTENAIARKFKRDGKLNFLSNDELSRTKDESELDDKLFRPHFGLTTNSQEMDKALDSADKETSKQKLLHAMVLVTMYASARVIPSQIREHPKRKISRPSETIISACVDSMHVHWGQEPMAAGLPICSRISAEDLVELLVGVGVKEIGPSTEMNAVRAFEKSVSRCREQLVQIISELFPLDCHN